MDTDLFWPLGWDVRTFNLAVHAVRMHRVPDLAATLDVAPETIRRAVHEIEAKSTDLGHYLFDGGRSPEAWLPSPHIPRVVLASVENTYVRDFSNPEHILKLDGMGLGDDLLVTRTCRDCGEIIVITIGAAAHSVRKFGLETGRYLPPSRCKTCKSKHRKESSQTVATSGEFRNVPRIVAEHSQGEEASGGR